MNAPLDSHIAFAMVVGPGEAEIAIDTLEGILHFYPNAELWIRNDKSSDGTWEALDKWAKGKAVHLSRNPVIQGYHGIAKSFCDLLLAIVESGTTPEFVVKIDPDAVLLKRGLVEAFQAKFATLGPGLCGVYKIGADGGLRDTRMHFRDILMDSLPIGLGHDRAIRWKLIFYFKHLIRALRHGYAIGENIQGGTMALHGRTLAALAESGFLAVPTRYIGRLRFEDILLALGAKSVGHGLHSINDHPDKVVAWVRPGRLHGFTADELLDKGYFVVHPIKKQDASLREAFRKNRLGIRARNGEDCQVSQNAVHH
jgi:hypothetical protein